MAKATATLNITMKIFQLSLLFILVTFFAQAQNTNSEWPVLKSYESEYLKRIAMPVGGIGTGTVSLAGNGAIQDWEIMSRPAKGFNAFIPKGPPVNRAPFFAINIQEEEITFTIKNNLK